MWQPIETAPVGVAVRLGYWRVAYDGRCQWQEESGPAFVRFLFFFKRATHGDATHWKPLPEPPDMTARARFRETDLTRAIKEPRT